MQMRDNYLKQYNIIVYQIAGKINCDFSLARMIERMMPDFKYHFDRKATKQADF